MRRAYAFVVLSMHNQYQLFPAKMARVVVENANTKTFDLKLKNQNLFAFLAGQFMMIGAPGFGECAISISSNPTEAKKHFSLTIRAVGELTRKLNTLNVGDTVYVRGPFGNGFPEVNKNLILIGGGCGFIPLRSVYEENKKRKDIKIQMLIGCGTQEVLVFAPELKKIKEKHDLKIIFEKEALPEFNDKKGFVTDLIKKSALLKNALVFVCGPEAMYPFVAKELVGKGVKPEDIFFSLEKRMHCGVGVCQHCAIGTRYVCKDGPVFDYKFLQEAKYI